MECETQLKISGLRSYGTAPVDLLNGLSSFAHVLNVSPTEEVWPEAVCQFFGDLFAMRLAGEDEVYALRGGVWEHMRNEVLRQSGLPECCSLESIHRSQFMVDCYFFNGAYAEELYGEAMHQEPLLLDKPLPHVLSQQDNSGSFPDDFLFCDGSDDDEVDGLDSELLLTEELITPDACRQQRFGRTLNSQCPVRISPIPAHVPPTEQEDK